jgi:hypothetical protein
MAEETQEGQKTLVSFVVGLLIGGMLVWAFSGPSADAPVKSTEKDSTEKSTDADNQSSDNDEKVDSKDSNDVSSNDATKKTEPVATLKVGDGAISVSDQPAGTSIIIDSAVYPVSEGWVGVRGYNDEKLGSILGVVRFSESQGLVPEEIVLQTPTKAGSRYAVVVFTEDGTLNEAGRLWFNLDGDVQIDKIFDTFSAK